MAEPLAAGEIQVEDVIEIGGQPGVRFVVLGRRPLPPRPGETERQLALQVEPVGGGARQTLRGDEGQTVYLVTPGAVRRGRQVVAGLVSAWRAARLALAATEAAEHPDVTDVLGRTWTWWKGDLYRHDSMAWPLVLVTSDLMRWPKPELLDNPNYQWCDTCRAELEARRG